MKSKKKYRDLKGNKFVKDDKNKTMDFFFDIEEIPKDRHKLEEL